MSKIREIAGSLRQKFREAGLLKKLLILGVLAALVYGGYRFLGPGGPPEPEFPGEGEMMYPEVMVERGDVKKTIYAAGNAIAESEETISVIPGAMVRSVNVSLDQEVQAGTLLYTLDDTEARLALRMARLEYDKKRKEYADYGGTKSSTITAGVTGIVKEMNLEPGSQVTPDTVVALVETRNRLVLRNAFNVNDAARFSVGETVKVFLPDYIYFMDARVTAVDTANTVTASGGITRIVTLELENPGSLKAGDKARVQTDKGGTTISALENGELAYPEDLVVKAKTRGTIAAVERRAGDQVNPSTVLYRIEPGSAEIGDMEASLALEQSRLALEEATRNLEKYQVRSTVSGKVVELNVKAGEKSPDTGNAIVISSVGALKMRVVVDEYDVARIYVGQPAEVYFNAFGDEVFRGVVSYVSKTGVTESGNVNFRAEIQVDGAGKVLPGMSGDADIFVENRENVLVLPKEAVTIMEDGLGVVQIKNAEGLPEPLEVSLGVEGDSHVEITGGLNEGDMVLLMNGSMGGPMPFESPMIAQ